MFVSARGFGIVGVMRMVLGLVLLPSIAGAQAMIQKAPVETAGNLRVSVACADYNATPTKGLELTIDGAIAAPLGVNAVTRTYHQTDLETWHDGIASRTIDTDVGFLVEPGRHHVVVSAPGCERRAVDVVAVADHAEVILGRLEVTDPLLTSHTAAPDGHGLVFGGIMVAAIHGPATGGPRYVYDPHVGLGGWLSLTGNKRSLAYALDFAFTSNVAEGMTVDAGPSDHFSGREYRLTTQVRAGKRYALNDWAFGVGTGLGLDSWLMKGHFYGPTGVSPEADASWFLPMWTTLAYKPSCNWGIQTLVQYDFHPTSSTGNGFTVGTGLVLESSAACSRKPHMTVAPL